MSKDKVVVVFNNNGKTVDLEIPLNITANELVMALNEAYQLKLDTNDVKTCFLKAENPFALLKGNKLLYDFGVRNGTVINYLG